MPGNHLQELFQHNPAQGSPELPQHQEGDEGIFKEVWGELNRGSQTGS